MRIHWGLFLLGVVSLLATPVAFWSALEMLKEVGVTSYLPALMGFLSVLCFFFAFALPRWTAELHRIAMESEKRAESFSKQMKESMRIIEASTRTIEEQEADLRRSMASMVR